MTIPRALLPAALLWVPALAEAQLSLSKEGGVLGGPLTYQLSGDPLEPFFVAPSISQGPIPVGLFCPGDPRVILIGTELQSLGTLGSLDGAGAGQAIYAVPSIPGLQGTPLYAQAMTLFGAGCTIDDLSNQNAFALAQPDTVHDTLGPSVVARQGHTATALPDGRVLVIGGDEPDAAGVLTALDSVEIFDPQTQTFALAPLTLTAPRSTHTATLLADGRVLVAGGYDAGGAVVASAEIVDPVGASSTAVGSMSVGRTQHTATLLADGRVLALGGSSKFDLSDVLGSLAQAHRSAEVFDPSTGQWSPLPDLPIAADGLVGHGASLLGNGQVLVTAGVEVSVLFGIPIPSMVDDCHLWDPSTGWLGAAPVPGNRVYHGQLALPDGSALVVGGADGDFISLSFQSLATAQRYDPGTGAWSSAGSLNHPRAYPNLVLAGDEVVVAGGLSTIDVTSGSGTPEQNIEVRPVAGGAWAARAALALPREVARAAAFDGGHRVLIVGTGDNGLPTVDRTAEVYVR